MGDHRDRWVRNQLPTSISLVAATSRRLPITHPQQTLPPSAIVRLSQGASSFRGPRSVRGPILDDDYRRQGTSTDQEYDASVAADRTAPHRKDNELTTHLNAVPPLNRHASYQTTQPTPLVTPSLAHFPNSCVGRSEDSGTAGCAHGDRHSTGAAQSAHQLAPYWLHPRQIGRRLYVSTLMMAIHRGAQGVPIHSEIQDELARCARDR